MALTGKLTKNLVETFGAGRYGDGGGLYLVVDPSGARRWIVRVVVRGQNNKKGAPLRTDFGLGGADIVTLNQARERALEYRRMAKQGLNPRFNARQDVQTFEEVAQQVHIDRMPTWKNAKHGQQWITTLRDYALPQFAPHAFRKTLTIYGDAISSTMEQRKAWSMNLGHESMAVTVNSYLPVTAERQMALIGAMSPNARMVS
tara:strand:+ start:64 stop:669 length:606 start_codon:yes stop_codon:yes gene_type:complete